MCYLVFIAALIMASLSPAQAHDWEDRRVFTSGADAITLRILSSTDTEYLAPVIESYIAQTPQVKVEYLVTGTAQIAQIIRQNPSAYDLVISSAMDLQIKLVNDGFAAEISAMPSPDWAQWRNSLFGFTYEPAAIVVNAEVFAGRPLPGSRQELITLLRNEPELFRSRIGTYDITRSGLGYLFATQDARTSETYWRLTEVMGNLDTQLYCCSGEMIDDVASGRLAVAYNVLGSYAQGRKDVSEQIAVIFPSDFTTTMMRTAFVPAASENTEQATSFMQSLLNAFSSGPQDQSGTLPSLVFDASETWQTIIPLEPALLVYLDELKRGAFVAEWKNALVR